MKVKLKCFAFDAAIVLVNILILSKFMKGGWSLLEILLTGLLIGVSGVLHFVVPGFIEAKEEMRVKLKVKEQNDAKYAEFNSLMNQLYDMSKKNPNFSHVVNGFAAQLDAFNQKKEYMNRIIELNNGAAGDFLNGKNEEVQKFLLKNLKRFTKYLLVFEAKNVKRRSTARPEDEPRIQEILKSNNELSDLYDKLLDEVAMMGEDFNVNDPGLMSVIETFQELRVGEDDDESADGEITLEL